MNTSRRGVERIYLGGAVIVADQRPMPRGLDERVADNPLNARLDLRRDLFHDVDRFHVLVDLLDPRRPGNDRAHMWVQQDPGKGQLRKRAAELIRDLSEASNNVVRALVRKFLR